MVLNKCSFLPFLFLIFCLQSFYFNRYKYNNLLFEPIQLRKHTNSRNLRCVREQYTPRAYALLLSPIAPQEEGHGFEPESLRIYARNLN